MVWVSAYMALGRNILILDIHFYNYICLLINHCLLLCMDLTVLLRIQRNSHPASAVRKAREMNIAHRTAL